MATGNQGPGGLSEEDLYEALGELSGYLDVTPGDLRTIFELAWRHATERLGRTVPVREVMTRDVAAVPREASALAVAEAMAARGVSGVPVVEPDGRVAGVVSEKDLLARACLGGPPSAMALVAAALRAGGTLEVALTDRRAEDLMTSPALTVPDTASVGEALALLGERRVNRLPVVDAAGRLVGIVSRRDVLVAPAGGPP